MVRAAAGACAPLCRPLRQPVCPAGVAGRAVRAALRRARAGARRDRGRRRAGTGAATRRAARRSAHLHPAQPLLPARHARRRGLVALWRHASRLPARAAICDYVHTHLTFSYGSSDPRSTAVDVNTSGFGVCRDFTHLAISFCRALNIPARYVFGYLPGMDVPPDPAPMDFAAWMEVWLGDRWWTFDPRNNRRRKGRILIGRGRDASDVAMVTTFGAPVLESMCVHAAEEPA